MWRFRTGSPWRDLPSEFGPWRSAYDRFRIWATQGVFQYLMEAVIAEAAAQGQADLGLVSVDSATARAHYHAAGMALDSEQLAALEAAAASEKGAPRRDNSRRTDSARTARAPSVGGSADGTGPASRPLDWGVPGEGRPARSIWRRTGAADRWRSCSRPDRPATARSSLRSWSE